MTSTAGHYATSHPDLFSCIWSANPADLEYGRVRAPSHGGGEASALIYEPLTVSSFLLIGVCCIYSIRFFNIPYLLLDAMNIEDTL